MSKIDQLIKELCPNGVEWKTIEDACVSVTAGGDLPINFLKGQKSPSNEFPYPIYSNGTEANALYGYTDNYAVSKNAVTISARGTIGYHAVRQGQFTPIVRLITLIPNVELINIRFLNYTLDITPIASSGGSIPQLTVPMVKKISIPIPPLPIQEEIVKILDRFTSLEAELEAELEARKTQYEHYRNELLNFDGKDVKWNTIEDACDSVTAGGDLPISFLKGQKNPSSEFPYPIYSNGTEANALYGYTDNYVVWQNAVTISARGTIGYHAVRQGQFTPIVRLITLIPNTKQINIRFLNYILDITPIASSGGSIPQLTVPMVKKIKIPIPPLPEQERIVSILDKFDALVNDTSIGLPAEINARRKQYEYYRNRLLSFENINNG